MWNGLLIRILFNQLYCQGWPVIGTALIKGTFQSMSISVICVNTETMLTVRGMLYGSGDISRYSI